MTQFTQEFKKNALALLDTLTPTQITEKLGISKTAFYKWKQQFTMPVGDGLAASALDASALLMLKLGIAPDCSLWILCTKRVANPNF